MTDIEIWRAELDALLTALHVKLGHLKRGLDEAVLDLNLDVTEQNKLFQNTSLSRIREEISYIQQRFTRGDLLLKCYEAELRFALGAYDMTQLSDRQKGRINAIQKDIAVIQKDYIEKYSARVSIALKRRLGVYETMSDAVRWIDKYIVFAFGMGVMQSKDDNCPGLLELQELLVSLEKLPGMEEDAKALLKGIQSLKI